MAKLSRKEREMLESLQAKAEAPDSAPTNRSLNVNVDLSDPKQVKLAQRFGLLDRDDDDDDDNDGDDDDDESSGKRKRKTTEEPPRRRGFFNE